MNRNGRIYKEFDAYKISAGDCYLSLNYNETYKNALYDSKNVKTIKDRSQARAARSKTGFKVMVGDILFTKLWWQTFDKHQPVIKDGMAIKRNDKIVWYSMTGTPKGLSVREVLIEKITHKKQKYILKGIIEGVDIFNK